MPYLVIILLSLHVSSAIDNTLPMLFTKTEIESVNIHCIIQDSLSRKSIPKVQVTIENLGKSFKTTRSSFYALLAQGTYDFLLNADGYELFSKSISVSSMNNTFTFEMVKITDRARLIAQVETLNLYLLTFDNTLKGGYFAEAMRVMAMIDGLGIPSTVSDSIHMVYEQKKITWIDSFLYYAQTLEDSAKFIDALFFYNKIIEIDSLNHVAYDKVSEIEVLLAKKQSITTTPSTKTPEELERIYNDAVSKFFAEDYQAALKLFKTYLSYYPNHTSAKDYFKRTKARIKFLQQD